MIGAKVIVVWIWSELLFSMSSFTIYYETQSDIRGKSYCHFNFLGASVFNYERLDISRDWIRHPRKTFLSLEFAQSFCYQYQASRYITGLKRTSELKFIGFWICYELLFPITSISIYYGTQSDIRVKIYCRLNCLRASVFNFEHLNILRDAIRHPSKNLLSIEFAHNFGIQFRVSRHITGLNRTSE